MIMQYHSAECSKGVSHSLRGRRVADNLAVTKKICDLWNPIGSSTYALHELFFNHGTETFCWKRLWFYLVLKFLFCKVFGTQKLGLRKENKNLKIQFFSSQTTVNMKQISELCILTLSVSIVSKSFKQKTSFYGLGKIFGEKTISISFWV